MTPPSAEQVFVAWAKAHPAVSSACGGRVATNLHAVRPCLRVQRIGEPPVMRGEDRASLQVESWAEDQDGADMLMRTLTGALPDARGPVVPGAWIGAHEITSGPFFAPDEFTNLARYSLTATFLVYAYGG